MKHSPYWLRIFTGVSRLTIMAKAIAMLGFAATTLAATTFVQGDPARFTYKQMTTPFSGPCDVSEGTDGHVYVQELLANQIARYNQNTGELKEFPIPFTNPIFPNQTIPLPSQAKAVLLTCAIRNGFDGKMYFSNGLRNQLVQFDAKTEKIQVFTPPVSRPNDTACHSPKHFADESCLPSIGSTSAAGKCSTFERSNFGPRWHILHAD